jgi:hypothetical protein
MNQTVNQTNQSSVNFFIPCDVMVEIAEVILQAELGHNIIGVEENKRELLFTIYHRPDFKLHQFAMENIKAILIQYHQLYGNE